jgi:hypothetical protein
MANCVDAFEHQLRDILGFRLRGTSSRRIQAAQKRLKCQLPGPLAEFFKVAGLTRRLTHAHNRILEVNQLYFRDDMLIVCEENQNVSIWGIARADLFNTDPPVHQGWIDTTKKSRDWIIDYPTTSSFLVAMCYWQSMMGGMLYCGAGMAVRKRVALGHLQNDYTLLHRDHQCSVYGRPGLVFMIFKGGYACAGANSMSQRKTMQSLPGVKWNYVDPQDED